MNFTKTSEIVVAHTRRLTSYLRKCSINYLFQIKIITRCQGLREKHLQTPLKTKINVLLLVR